MVNRVKELEQQIAQLESTVNGLLEELSDTKARLNDLEEETFDETVVAPKRKLDADTGEIRNEPTEQRKNNDTDSDDTVDGDDDMIVV